MKGAGLTNNQYPVDPKPKRPWTPWQYIVLVFIAILIAVFAVRPIGLEIVGVFQRLTDAFKNRR
jgi:hypothetical protein